MICPNCNKVIKDGAKFCGHCGSDISLAKHSITDDSIDNIIVHGFTLLSSGSFDEAKELFDSATRKDAKNAQAMLGKLLCDLKLHNESELANCTVDFGENINYRSLLVFADSDTKMRVSSYQRKAAENAALAEKERKYSDACSALENERFADALALFEELGYWQDSVEKIEICNQGIERQRIEAEKRAEEKRIQDELQAKRIKKYAVIFSAALVVFIAIILVINNLIVPMSQYNKAEKLLKDGNYGDAYVILKDLGEFNNADERILQDKYERAMKEIEKGDYEYAYSILKQVGTYNNADQYILEHKYKRAKEHLTNNEYQKAFPLLSDLGQYAYSDATELLIKARYDFASKLKSEGKYEEAIEEYSTVSSYEDSSNQILSCKYLLAKEKYTQQLISEAYSLFKNISSYEDAASYIAKIETEYPTINFAKAECGDKVVFGKYEQDNNLENGKEELTWIVAKIDNGKMLLVSEKIIDRMPFNDEYVPISWEESTIRKWLNYNFVSSSFTAYEQNSIIKSEVDNSESCDDVKNTTTIDKVFLLNDDEYWDVRDYIRVSSYNIVTDYASEKDRSGDETDWWLRTPYSIDDNYGTFVEFISSGSYPCGYRLGVRPAMWVEIK